MLCTFNNRLAHPKIFKMHFKFILIKLFLICFLDYFSTSMTADNSFICFLYKWELSSFTLKSFDLHRILQKSFIHGGRRKMFLHMPILFAFQVNFKSKCSGYHWRWGRIYFSQYLWKLFFKVKGVYMTSFDRYLPWLEVMNELL